MIGYMPQRFGLYEDLTVLENLNLYAELRGVRGEERDATFKKLLAFTGLASFTSRLSGALSGGMKQKLGLACALVKKPTLLLLDEPSVGVDPLSRRELWKMVQGLKEEGISVVWSTAYLDEAEKCTSALLINEGKLLFHGSPHAFTDRVEGRVFKVSQIKGNRRRLLFDLLNREQVIDGLVQGQELRLVLKEKPVSSLGPEALGLPAGVQLRAAVPRFEDAFIDALGGCPKNIAQLETEAHQIAEGPVVQAEGLTKKFGAFVAADRISFSIPKGEIFGLLGPNGAGKSTTFKMLCGLLQPTEGRALLNRLDVQQAPGQARACLGYMAQKFSLYGMLTTQQNLHFFARIYNLKGSEEKRAVQRMLEIFKMQDYAAEPAEMLPLGFKQRLSLACAGMHEPDILFLDEPTSGVDPLTRREFWNQINGLVEKGVTVLVTTHFMDEAEHCDRIALVYRGKIIQIGTPDALKGRAKSVQNQDPTLEDAFIQLIEEYDASHPVS
jgi:ABC-2 type transport system ATP-binding protein